MLIAFEASTDRTNQQQQRQQKMDPQGVSIKWISDAKERGVLADRDFAEGDVIFEEQPMVCDQYLYNKDFFPTCEHCLACLESPADMVKRLAGLPEPPHLWGAEAVPLLKKVPCEHMCGELYCSTSCRDKAWAQYHSLLCLGPHPRGDHPLLEIRQEWKSFHFPPESATIGLLVKMLAMIAVTRDEALFDHFKADYRNETLHIVAKFMDEQFSDRLTTFLRLFRDLFAPHGLHVSQELFDKLLTIVSLNGQGIGTSSFEAYERILRNLSAAAEEKAGSPEALAVTEALDQVDALREAIEEHSDDFTHAEGTGLYRAHAMINHACVPNAEIQFVRNNATLRVVATRDIAKGAEVTISYMHFDGCDSDSEEEEDEDEEESDHEHGHHGHDHGHDHEEHLVDVDRRREMLREYYLFECTCDQCLADSGASKAAPAVPSSSRAAAQSSSSSAAVGSSSSAARR
ncbi:SET and MYND domain-containing protein 5 [Allomyces javanicus]|nr:SET and MYND domain-containing protein 5 [Allomyces javanicus]